MTPGLSAVADRYLDAVLASLRREYPNAPRHVTRNSSDRPTPRETHPAFYGCFDWHSAVEMHWAAARLAASLGTASAADRVAEVFDEHLSEANLFAEANYLRTNPGFERPYGWGWLLTLAEELVDTRWGAPTRVAADVATEGFLAWLPSSPLPNRQGAHANTAFALRRSWGWAGRLAEEGDPRLREAIVEAGRRWYLADTDYPASWEPSAGDFLSAALAEAELMAVLLGAAEFPPWLERFLPGLPAGRPESLFAPLTGVDETDGQSAHLLGLNLHRAAAFGSLNAWCQSGVIGEAIEAHLDASLPAVIGGDWMAEHWLAAYAVLALDRQ